MTDESKIGKEIGTPTLKGVGSWGVVYILTTMLAWGIVNGVSDNVTIYLLMSVMLMWLIKLFEKKISGEHDLEMIRLNNGK